MACLRRLVPYRSDPSNRRSASKRFRNQFNANIGACPSNAQVHKHGRHSRERGKRVLEGRAFTSEVLGAGRALSPPSCSRATESLVNFCTGCGRKQQTDFAGPSLSLFLSLPLKEKRKEGRSSLPRFVASLCTGAKRQKSYYGRKTPAMAGIQERGRRPNGFAC